jgi:uncharacterized LabA/DUF88 family protein
MYFKELTLEKIAIFVDVQNIYYTTRDTFQKSFNYRLLMETLSYAATIEYAFAYAIDRQDDGQRKFQNMLRHIGFEVKLKPFIQRSDGSAKGDWDVGITIDILEAAPLVDHIILLSGDGDFAMLLDNVMQKYKIKTSVYGVPQLTAKALIDSCNTFHPITNDLLL